MIDIRIPGYIKNFSIGFAMNDKTESNVDAEVELFVTILTSICGPRGLVPMYRVAKQYAKLRNVSGATPSERTKNAGSELRRFIRKKHRPPVDVVWAIFESARLAGLDWCSGFLGLFAAAYIGDVVGMLWCLRQHYYGDPWWADRLQALVVYSPLAIKGNLIGWEVDNAAVTEARSICTLEEDLRSALEKAWESWQRFDHRLESLCRCEGFPATDYARAHDTRLDIRHRETAIGLEIFWINWARS